MLLEIRGPIELFSALCEALGLPSAVTAAELGTTAEEAEDFTEGRRGNQNKPHPTALCFDPGERSFMPPFCSSRATPPELQLRVAQ